MHFFTRTSARPRFQPLGEQPLAKTARGAKFPVQADEVLAAMEGDRSAYIRAAVLEKMQADGLLNSEALVNG